jgi:pimeloyl-ACP methyl ester carboxylesterase
MIAREDFLNLPPATREGEAANGNVRLSWRAYGDGSAVLLIMGFMATGDAFFRLLPHIIEAGFAPVVFDNRGTGASTAGPGLWTMDDLVGDTLAVMNAADLRRAHVVGASMGGMIAQHLALGYPDRLRSLVLACTEPAHRLLPPPWRMLAAVGLRPLLGSRVAEALAAPALYSREVREHGRERLADDARLREDEATPVITALAQFAAIVRHDTRKRLRDIRVPVLVLHGAEEN